MTDTLQQVYTDHPHAIVSSHNEFEAVNDRDFDLVSTLQFVNDGHAVLFDFSAYVLVDADLSDLEVERDRLATEIAAFNALREAVDNAHDEFLVNASKALDRLASLQNSKS